ncbi:MAG: hypothetical protein QOK30_1243 [Nocardioidaceae bacterium]|nr:hypothetical protein [Nocardioidaceae bacterium]
MTSHTVHPPAEQNATELRLPPPGAEAGWSMSSAALIAGVATLLMSVLAGFGNFVAVHRVVTQGDAARTAHEVMASEGVFRLGIVSLFLVVALDVVAAWALYRVFSPVSRGVSLLAALFRLVYTGVFLVAISQLVSAVHLIGADPSLSVFTPAQLQARALSTSALTPMSGRPACSSSGSTCSSSATWRTGRGTFLGSSVCCSPWPAWGTGSTASPRCCPTAPGPMCPRSPSSASSCWRCGSWSRVGASALPSCCLAASRRRGRRHDDRVGAARTSRPNSPTDDATGGDHEN